MRLHFVLRVNLNTDGWLNCILLILVTTNLTEGSGHCVLCLELPGLENCCGLRTGGRCIFILNIIYKSNGK